MYFTHYTVKALAVLTGKCYLDFKVTLLPSTCILYKKSDLCIPRNETEWPHSQFRTSCI
jgi:hypothetical protein